MYIIYYRTHLCGGYTHANWIYADQIIKDVTSFDFVSSYPYTLVTDRFPCTEFRKCNIKSREQMINNFAYLLVVEFTDIKCKYFNTFISASKCQTLYNASYDNGRLIAADKITITLTDIDFYFILDTYKIKSYKILECYYSSYNYLPKKFIDFVLEKYINKTTLKNVEGMEVEYAKEKNKFNSLYGMSVTNMISDEVTYTKENDWQERELENKEIIAKLAEEKRKAFLSFSYGVWVTAYARNNLLRNVIKLDEDVVYCDTDSAKVKKGYNKKVIEDYNKSVVEKIKKVSKLLDIPFDNFCPKDSKGNRHLLGIFEEDAKYEEFITQGAKKYAYTKWIDKKKIKGKVNIQDTKENKIKILEITVAGVPKSRCARVKKFRSI